MDKFQFFETDCDSVLSQMKHQDKQLKLKRRFLLGTSTSESEHRKSRRLGEFMNVRFLPESLLREDDIFFETIKSRVEEAFGLRNVEKECTAAQTNEGCFGIRGVVGSLGMRLDALTNKGLYIIAMILTGGSIKFEKTRPRMKEVIRDSLLNFSGHKKLRQMSQVLSDPRNSRKNCIGNLAPTIQSHWEDAAKVLDELESLPFQALMAMRRRLRSMQSIPQLKPPKSGRSRSQIIKQVREASLRMLSESCEEDKLPEQLAMVMAIADLSFKLSADHKNISAGGFYQFSAEIKNLQNEIVKAIWLLKTKVRFPELKKLQLLLDPKADVPNGCLRTAIKKMLTEYLFESTDMKIIPKSLLEALAVVNRSSRSVEPKLLAREEVEEDVECILSISAEIKQLAWDWLTDHDFDQDFTDAYKEELEDSDDGDYDYDDGDDTIHSGGHDGCDNGSQQVELEIVNSISEFSNSDLEGESMAETIPVELRTPLSVTGGFAEAVVQSCLTGVHYSRQNNTPSVLQTSTTLNGRQSRDFDRLQVKIERDEAEENSEMDCEIQQVFHSCSSFENRKLDSVKDNCINQNKYLAVQEVCDETGTVAYDIIGHLLEKLAEEQGLDLDWKSKTYLGSVSVSQDDKRGDNRKHASPAEKFGGSGLHESVLKKLKELMDA